MTSSSAPAPASDPTPPPASSWTSAARLVARWLDRRERLDALLDTLPRSLAGTDRARCQHLVMGVVRHFGRLDAALGRRVAHPPRFATRAILYVAGFELIEALGDREEGRAARIVHHAVEQTKALASPAEARLVNAVVRKLISALAGPAPGPDASAEELGEYFSHPAWLVRSWLAQFGPEATRALLEWNQQPAPVHARWRAPAGEAVPDFLRPTRWPGLFEVAPGKWPAVEPLLRAGKLYLQDPSTRIPVDLLAPVPGESVLDLCAAPGGKSLALADAMSRPAPAPVPDAGTTGPDPAPAAEPAPAAAPAAAPSAGQLVAVDLLGPRIERLKENLARITGLEVALVQADALGDLVPILREHRLPEKYPAVLLDVPCSNTGVMRHRIDVKWRLEPGDFKKHPRQQLSLLHAAARLVASGGRLVYSTCSLDTEENAQVVRAFLAGKAGGPFTLERSVISTPWADGHDGGAAFLLRKA